MGIHRPIDAGKTPKQRSHVLTLKWEFTENELDSQPFHSNAFRTGFAFEHDREVFQIHVEIDGKLQKRTRPLKEAFRFPPKAKQNQGSTVTRVDVQQTKQFKRQLDSLAIGLPGEMIKRNQLDIPVEVPNSMPSLFQEWPSVSNSPVPDSQSRDPEDYNGNSHAQMNSTASPSAQELISAAQIVGIRNQKTSNISHPSPSSSATLVAGSSSEGDQKSQTTVISSAAAKAKR